MPSLVRQLIRSDLRALRLSPIPVSALPYFMHRWLSFSWGKMKVLSTYDCLKRTPTRSGFASYICRPLFASLWRLVLLFQFRNAFGISWHPLIDLRLDLIAAASHNALQRPLSGRDCATCVGCACSEVQFSYNHRSMRLSQQHVGFIREC